MLLHVGEMLGVAVPQPGDCGGGIWGNESLRFLDRLPGEIAVGVVLLSDLDFHPFVPAGSLVKADCGLGISL